jgi:nucleoside-diphosphate-sugar epimerase
MRVFVAGATGAIGKQLVPRLVAAGHEVHGMTRSESKLGDALRAGRCAGGRGRV